MSKTMAEVLAEHIYKPSEAVCSCSDFVQVGLNCDPQTHPQHVAEVLSAAGFGLVADAKAEALEEAADIAATKHGSITGPELASWLRAFSARGHS